MKRKSLLLALWVVVALVTPSAAVNVLLNSWETATGNTAAALEDWEDSFGTKVDPASLMVVSGVGNTDGSNALQFVLTANGFEWSIQRYFEPGVDAQYDDFLTALANPAFHRIEYDLTYDLTWSNPQTGDFFTAGLSISALEGSLDNFHQGFNLYGLGDVAIMDAGGLLSGTVAVGQQLSDFSNQPFVTNPEPGFLRPIIPLNGTWDAPATFVIDNFRITEAAPPQDLDGDLDVDLDDFDIFMMWHKTDFTGLDAAMALARGDFDGDFDNDFDDFLRFEQVYDVINGAGAFRNAVPEPMSVVGLVWGVVFMVVRRRRLVNIRGPVV